MATVGEVNVTVNLDVATAALAAIREHASKTFVDQCSATAYGDALCDIVRMTQDALAQCRAEQSEFARLRAAIRELARGFRGWECKDGPVTGVYYEGRITEEVVAALESLVAEDVQPDAVR